MLGTLVNTGTIVVGSLIGISIGSRLPQRVVHTIFQAMGLFTIAIGVYMSLESENSMVVIISLVTGAIIGEWADLEGHLFRFSDYLERQQRKKKNNTTKPGAQSNPIEQVQQDTTRDKAEQRRSQFSEGFITSSMLFCIGSMGILGAFEDAMGRTPQLLYTKSVMDGVSAIILASTFGIAVLFSALPVFMVQGSLTLFAACMMRFMSTEMIANMTGAGGVMLIGLGISILKIKTIRITNMLPALVIAVLLSYFW